MAKTPPKRHRAGPAEFKAAFDFCYEAAGRADEVDALPVPGAPAGAGGLFGGLARLFGGAGGGGGGAGGGARRAARPRPLEADLRALKSLDATLLRLGAVYSDAETRAQR